MCEINKNKLLTLYFHEGGEREEKIIQKHVHRCKECQEYISFLEKTHLSLSEWKDEKPHADTLNMILKRIPQKQVKPVSTKLAVPVFPLLMIISSVLVMLTIILVLKDKITRFPFWESIENLWIVQQMGSFGVTTVLVFLLGILISLSLTPILIFESRSKNYRYTHN
jgi:hypothetical protein